MVSKKGDQLLFFAPKPSDKAVQTITSGLVKHLARTLGLREGPPLTAGRLAFVPDPQAVRL